LLRTGSARIAAGVVSMTVISDETGFRACPAAAQCGVSHTESIIFFDFFYFFVFFSLIFHFAPIILQKIKFDKRESSNEDCIASSFYCRTSVSGVCGTLFSVFVRLFPHQI
jgi:hypothetical protein